MFSEESKLPLLGLNRVPPIIMSTFADADFPTTRVKRGKGRQNENEDNRAIFARDADELASQWESCPGGLETEKDRWT